MYPNRLQWIVLWTAAILVLTRCDYRFFTALGGYRASGVWMWPQVTGYQGWPLVAAIAGLAALCFWQLSKPVSLRSPILLPAGFAVVCLVWYAFGAVRHEQELRAHSADPLDAILESTPPAKR